MAESEEEENSFLKRVKEKSEKTGLKFSIQKAKIMASGPTTSWQIDGEKQRKWQSLFSWAPEPLWVMTAAKKLEDTCSLEGKLWQTHRAYYKAEASVCIARATVFPVVHVWCESWTIKKAERRRIDAFELWC